MTEKHSERLEKDQSSKDDDFFGSGVTSDDSDDACTDSYYKGRRGEDFHSSYKDNEGKEKGKDSY